MNQKSINFYKNDKNNIQKNGYKTISQISRNRYKN